MHTICSSSPRSATQVKASPTTERTEKSMLKSLPMLAFCKGQVFDSFCEQSFDAVCSDNARHACRAHNQHSCGSFATDSMCIVFRCVQHYPFFLLVASSMLRQAQTTQRMDQFFQWRSVSLAFECMACPVYSYPLGMNKSRAQYNSRLVTCACVPCASHHARVSHLERQGAEQYMEWNVLHRPAIS